MYFSLNAFRRSSVFFSVSLVLPDLLVDELDRGARIHALVAQARIDEDRQQRLNDLSGLFGLLDRGTK